MNFINAVIDKRGDDIFLKFGENEIRLPEAKAKKLENSDYIGREVVMGVRPESIHDEDAAIQAMPDSIVTANVEVVEMLGSETLLHMYIDDVSVTARVNPRTKTRSGDVIKVAIDPARIHLFDKDTEKTIIN